MLNYDYQNKTRLIFGKDTQKEIGSLIKPYADKVLLHYGGGSIKRSGLYDQVVASLNEAGVKFVELGGVKPNPRLSLVNEGIKLCREDDIQFILAVGGGSVIDSAKSIAIGVPYDGDVWDFYSGKEITEALPVATILTIPATGSESSFNAVLTNEELALKVGIGNDLMRPVFSILNPELCKTLPMDQIANSAFDMMSHIMERYFTNSIHTDVIDGLAESLMRTIMKEALILREDPTNYDAWCELVQAGNLAHNGQLGLGREEDWTNHGLEHEMGAIYDCAHGAGLAVTTVAWMKYVYKKHLPMFVQFAVNVMGCQGSFREPEKLAMDGILKLEEYCKKMGLPVRMGELGIDDKNFEVMAKKCTGNGTGTMGSMEPLT